MIITCESSTGIANGIILFGLFRPIVHYTEEKLNRMGLEEYTTAIDQNGYIYKVYSDYDPCINVSCVVAVPKTDAEIIRYISEYLNDWLSNDEYLTLYNRFARDTGEKLLTDTEEIFTENNKQGELIDHIYHNRTAYRDIFRFM